MGTNGKRARQPDRKTGQGQNDEGYNCSFSESGASRVDLARLLGLDTEEEVEEAVDTFESFVRILREWDEAERRV